MSEDSAFHNTPKRVEAPIQPAVQEFTLNEEAFGLYKDAADAMNQLKLGKLSIKEHRITDPQYKDTHQFTLTDAKNPDHFRLLRIVQDVQQLGGQAFLLVGDDRKREVLLSAKREKAGLIQRERVEGIGRWASPRPLE